MKKLIAILLAALMLFGACAFAGEAEEITEPGSEQNFSLTMTEVPAGFTLTVLADNLLCLVNEDETLGIFISAENSDILGSYTLTRDLTDEQKAELELICGADYNDPTFDYSLETAFGTPLILVNENGAASDSADIFTIYEGFFIGCSILHTDGEVTDADIAVAVEALSNTWTVSK